MTKRNLIVAAFTLTVLAAAGCGAGDAGLKPAATRSALSPMTSSPTSSPTSTVDPKAQPAVDAYLAYISASNSAQRKPQTLGEDIVPRADYTKYSFDPEQSEFSAVLYQLSASGLRMEGDPGRPMPAVRTVDLGAKPYPLVVLADCPTPAVRWDAHEVKTGKDVSVAPPSGTVPSPYRTTVQMISDQSHWGVSKITTDASHTCSG